MEDAARSLGSGRWRRLRTIDVPLMLPGLAAGAGLVLLSTMKELPATLLLAPIGFDTLATRIWSATESAFFARAGINALALDRAVGRAHLAADDPAVGTARRVKRLTKAMLLLGVGVMVWTAPLAAVRATDGERTTADEPQYLLSALSLGEDRSLDIRDERAAERHREFHESGLPLQEGLRPDGSRVSPHDPLLPVVLAMPMTLGGWVAAKLTLAALAGGLAALMLWVAVRRFAVPLGVARARGGGLLAGGPAGGLRHAGVPRAARRDHGHGGDRCPSRPGRPASGGSSSASRWSRCRGWP